MIINSLANVFSSILVGLFKFFTLPLIPEEVETVIFDFFDLVFENSSLLGLFVSIDLLKKLCAIYILIFAFKHIYDFFIWVSKKIPFFSK